MSELSIQLFSTYSEQYDRILQHSIPYQEIIQLVKDTARLHFKKEEPIRILDVGGGTGNFSSMLLQIFPNCTIDFLEPSEEMMAYAIEKLDNQQMTYINQSFEAYAAEEKYDLIICIHCLYLMEDPEKAISKFKDLLKPSGKLILCDIGKKLNLLDWSIYYFFSFWKHYGIRKTMELFLTSEAFFTGNQRIQAHQKQQKSWRHTLDVLKNKFFPYFQRVEGCRCFRGYSGFLVCGC